MVENSESFYQLHHIIQIAFGWENSHLYEFRAGGQVLANPKLMETMEEVEITDDKSVVLKELFKSVGDKLDYLYDFGDHWEHLITLEKVLDPGNSPFCLAGERSGPLEDCGGIRGYEHMLQNVNNRGLIEYQGLFDQHPGVYDPNLVDLDKINEDLSQIQQYIEKYESEW